MATRTEIRTRARIRADQDQSSFPTDAQYDYLIDEAGRDVWMDLIQGGWPVKPSSTTLSVTSQFTSLFDFVVQGLVVAIAPLSVSGLIRRPRPPLRARA